MVLPPESPGAPAGNGPAPGFACLMADCLGDILLVVEAATLRVVFANTRARAALGDGQGDLAGRDIRDLETELVDQAYWDEAAAGQFTATQRVETCYWREDGAMLNVEKSTYLRPWEGRDYIVVHSREVTERHEVEEELARSASQLRAALESTADGILVVSPEGGIVNLNHQFTRLWRIPEGLVAERDDAAVFTALQASLARPEEHPLREEALLSDPEAATGGTLELRDGRMLEYKSLPQYLRGHVIGRVFSFRDITAMIAHERDLVAARDLAAKASEAKSAFLAAMSHEIRTPMNGILGMTELALDTPLTALQREYLEAAHHSAEALLAIINDILDFSKIEAGRLELESTPFSPAEVLSETLRILAPRAEARRTELVLDMLSELPASVEGDPVRLRQILLNLLGNAVKFTEGGVVVLAARLGACADDGGVWLEFQVRDTGIGIPRDKQESIFDTFTQADHTITRRYGGTGLGLAISRRLVEAMDGRIWVDSELGKGSTFHFTIRLRGVEGEETLQTLPGRQARLLVVARNPDCRTALARMAGRAGAAVVTAANLAEAREALAAPGADFSHVLLDEGLEDGAGGVLAGELQAGPHPPHWAYLATHGRLGGVSMAQVEYLLKPVSPAVLARFLAAPPVAPAEPVPAGPLNLLLVDRDPVSRKIVQIMLERLGHRCDPVKDGEEALARWRSEAVDVILLAVDPSESDFGAILETLRQEASALGQTTPVVALVANLQDDGWDRCRAAGFDEVLSKPPRYERLGEVLSGVLSAQPGPSGDR